MPDGSHVLNIDTFYPETRHCSLRFFLAITTTCISRRRAPVAGSMCVTPFMLVLPIH